MLCAELSGTNCRAELSARNCPAPNCPRGIVLRRIVRAELSCADLSGHRSLSNWVTDLINPVVDIHCCGSVTVELPSPEVSGRITYCLCSFLFSSLFLPSYSVWFAAGFGSGTSSIHPLYRSNWFSFFLLLSSLSFLCRRWSGL